MSQTDGQTDGRTTYQLPQHNCALKSTAR